MLTEVDGAKVYAIMPKPATSIAYYVKNLDQELLAQFILFMLVINTILAMLCGCCCSFTKCRKLFSVMLFDTDLSSEAKRTPTLCHDVEVQGPVHYSFHDGNPRY